MATKEKRRGRFTKKTRQADMIRRAQKHTQERQEQEARKAKAPAVSYNQPTPFNPRRLAMQLGLVAAVVVAMGSFVSLFPQAVASGISMTRTQSQAMMRFVKFTSFFFFVKILP